MLIDERALSSESEGESDDVLRFFLRSELVQAWFVLPPFSHNTETKNASPGSLAPVIKVQELTGTQGRFEQFGITYGYTMGGAEGDAAASRAGNFSIQDPKIALLAAGVDSEIVLDEIKEATALRELAIQINVDIVITEEYLKHEEVRAALGYSSLVSRESAVKIFAHYFRTQGHFITGVDPHEELDSDDYYTYAVYANCPHLYHWLGKVNRTVEFYGNEYSAHLFYADIAISRCSRALRRYDDLLLYLGRPLTKTNIDDAIDTLDHILVSLCAAIDSLARSLNEALETGHKLPKLHDKQWVKDYLRPVYGEVPEYSELLEQRLQIEHLFKFRNSIHSLGLMPYFEKTAEQPVRSHLLLRVCIPPTSKDAWEKMDSAARKSWGLVEYGEVAHADIQVFTQKCFEVAFSFIDALTEIVSFEPIRDKSPVLYENIIMPGDPKHIELAKFIASVSAFNSPLLSGRYAPGEKRKLKSDCKSTIVHKLELLLRRAGWKPSPDFQPLRQPPTTTTYLNHEKWRR